MGVQRRRHRHRAGAGQPVPADGEGGDGLGQALELTQTGVLEGVVAAATGEQAHELGHEDLAPLGHCAQAGGLHDGGAEAVAVLQGDVAAAHAHADGNGDGAHASLPPPPYGIALTAGGKVMRFALSSLAGVSNRKGRSVVRLDPAFKGDVAVGVEATDGTENVCLATRQARVLIFPVTEANVVAGAAKGVTAVKLDARDRVLGFALANKMREGLQVRTNRGATQFVRATKYPVTSRGGKGYGVLQRGSLDAILHDEARPVPPVEEVGE